MKTELQADDIRVGMYITVLHGREKYKGEYGGTLVKTEDSSWKGSVLKVLVIEFPYVVVQEITDRFGNSFVNHSPRSGLISMDIRDRTFTKLSDEYVKAMTGVSNA